MALRFLYFAFCAVLRLFTFGALLRPQAETFFLPRTLAYRFGKGQISASHP